MKTQSDRLGEGFMVGLAILAVGVVIGMLLQPEEWLASPAILREPPELPKNLAQRAEVPDVPVNGLETLSLTIDEDSARVLQRVREKAMTRGMIIQTDADTVPAVVRHGDKSVKAKVRIKGDWTDHVSTPKWSLRITLEDDRLFGMRVFSIQSPHTRGYMWEWLVHEAARREGVLAPRSNFINVVVNNNSAGIYFLEEHFSKEMLESQGRREGPIVRWDESTRWASLLQVHNVYSKKIELPVPKSTARAVSGAAAFISAYGEKRLGSLDSLNRSFASAVDQMRGLQSLVVASSRGQDRMRRLQALSDLQGKTIESLLDVDRMATAHALASFFQLQHSLYWINMRFYHDPVLDRLEPFMYDNMAQVPAGRDPVLFRFGHLIPQLVTSPRYYNGVFEHLGRLCRPEYLDDLLADLGDDLRRFESALNAEHTLAEIHTVDNMIQRLRTEQSYLRGVIYPVDPINAAASYELQSSDGVRVKGTAEVSTWSTTRAPVVVVGFRYRNGVFESALSWLVDASGTSTAKNGGVVLPVDGRTVTFRFPLNERLANLENVSQVLAAERKGSDGTGKLDLNIDIIYRSVASDQERSERLDFRKRDPSWDAEGGRPDAPTLEEALASHPFLEYEPEQARLRIMPGTWKVSGDLIVPSGMTLYARGSVRLQFEEEAVLVSDGPLIFEGREKAPVILEPAPGAETWKGVVVLKASGRSIWKYVTVRNTDAVERAGWVVTGGITFYHSPVTMIDCRIEGTVAEDGTNIFGTDFLMERVTFAGCVSDSFDGDFVSGKVIDCTFEDGLADGVDFSGSNVDVIDCKFLRMGDKAISAGENTVVRVSGGIADDVSIGIASKDRSRVEVTGMTIRNARNYALAAFIKKPEFGPSSLIATDLVIEGSGLGDTIVQTGCELELDGVAVPTQDLDVGQLYEDKILGQ